MCRKNYRMSSRYLFCELLGVFRQSTDNIRLYELNHTRLRLIVNELNEGISKSRIYRIYHNSSMKIVDPRNNSPAVIELSREFSGSFVAFASKGDPLGGKEGAASLGLW